MSLKNNALAIGLATTMAANSASADKLGNNVENVQEGKVAPQIASQAATTKNNVDVILTNWNLWVWVTLDKLYWEVTTNLSDEAWVGFSKTSWNMTYGWAFATNTDKGNQFTLWTAYSAELTDNLSGSLSAKWTAFMASDWYADSTAFNVKASWLYDVTKNVSVDGWVWAKMVQADWYDSETNAYWELWVSGRFDNWMTARLAAEVSENNNNIMATLSIPFGWTSETYNKIDYSNKLNRSFLADTNFQDDIVKNEVIKNNESAETISTPTISINDYSVSTHTISNVTIIPTFTWVEEWATYDISYSPRIQTGYDSSYSGDRYYTFDVEIKDNWEVYIDEINEGRTWSSTDVTITVTNKDWWTATTVFTITTGN